MGGGLACDDETNLIPYRCHRFPPDIIQHAVWLYCRFTLSFRDVEDLLAERVVSQGWWKIGELA